MLKTLVKAFLRRRGLELKLIGAPVRGPEDYIRHLKAKGFRPGTVIDIGVARGTPWLYRFPEAKLVLVEPNPAYASDLARIKAEHRADVLPYAAGAKAGALDLHVDQHAPSSSSFYQVSKELSAYWRRLGQDRRTEKLRVDVRPLDALIDHRHPEPFLIKIDTEGFELDVLRGAVQTLARASCLIVETSVAKRHEGSYEFAELIGFLDAAGFAFTDILDVQSFGVDGDISYMDIAFTRRDRAGQGETAALTPVSRPDDAAA